MSVYVATRGRQHDLDDRSKLGTGQVDVPELEIVQSEVVGHQTSRRRKPGNELTR